MVLSGLVFDRLQVTSRYFTSLRYALIPKLFFLLFESGYKSCCGCSITPYVGILRRK